MKVDKSIYLFLVFLFFVQMGILASSDSETKGIEPDTEVPAPVEPVEEIVFEKTNL